jgi:homoserine/homoserine lactone efflux protein
MTHLSPGAGAVASISSGAAHGWRRGIWTAVGQQLALLLFLAISAVGVASLLVSIPGSIRILSALGAAYLAWVGLRLLWGAAFPPYAPHESQSSKNRRSSLGTIPPSARGMLLYGFLANASNPKALLSLFVITPRFIDPAQALPFQYILIAATMVGIDLVVMSGYTAIGARFLRILDSEIWRRRVDAFFGCLFLFVAAFVARG